MLFSLFFFRILIWPYIYTWSVELVHIYIKSVLINACVLRVRAKYEIDFAKKQQDSLFLLLFVCINYSSKSSIFIEQKLNEFKPPLFISPLHAH
jgi:hypothetical protein